MCKRLALLFLATMLTAGTADARTQASHGPTRASSSRIIRIPDLQVQVLTAINDLRQSKGLTPLRLNGALSDAALGHSESMAERGFFEHTGSDGSPFWTRIKPKYPPVQGSQWGVGENLVWASPALSADQAVQMWLNSPPHRKNLLTPAWREIGLGAVHAQDAPGVYGGRDVTILTADFGVR
jgi:uncharacterized protein YkwD